MVKICLEYTLSPRSEEEREGNPFYDKKDIAQVLTADGIEISNCPVLDANYNNPISDKLRIWLLETRPKPPVDFEILYGKELQEEQEKLWKYERATHCRSASDRKKMLKGLEFPNSNLAQPLDPHIAHSMRSMIANYNLFAQ